MQLTKQKFVLIVCGSIIYLGGMPFLLYHTAFSNHNISTRFCASISITLAGPGLLFLLGYLIVCGIKILVNKYKSLPSCWARNEVNSSKGK